MSALLPACAVPEELVSPVQPWQWVLPPVNGREVHLGEETNLGPLPPMRIQNRKGPYYIVMKLHTITKNVIVVSPYYNVNGTMCILFYQHMHTNIPLFGNYIKNVVNYQQCKM
jgi:hypothetical protein